MPYLGVLWRIWFVSSSLLFCPLPMTAVHLSISLPLFPNHSTPTPVTMYTFDWPQTESNSCTLSFSAKPESYFLAYFLKFTWTPLCCRCCLEWMRYFLVEKLVTLTSQGPFGLCLPSSCGHCATAYISMHVKGCLLYEWYICNLTVANFFIVQVTFSSIIFMHTLSLARLL